MKKIFSLFAAVLFAGSMMADYVPVSSVAAGDEVVMGCADVNMEFKEISTTSTKYGIGEEFTTAPAGLVVFTVEAGSNEGTFAFKTSDNKYLTWTSGNSLNLAAAKSENTSWKLTFKTDYVEIANAADETRIIWWNGGSPRFACYTAKSHGVGNYYGPTLYKEGAGSAVAKPVIAGETSFFDETEVSITCETEGAKIYYTIDGAEPSATSTEYTGAFKLNASATVKAIAIKGEDKSTVVEKEFVKTPSYNSIEDLVASSLASGKAMRVSFTAVEIDSVFTIKAGNRRGIYVHVLAGEKDVEIYYGKDDVPAEWKVGGTVSGTITGTWTLFNSNQWEIVPAGDSWKWTELTYKAPLEVVTAVSFTGFEGFFKVGMTWNSSARSDLWLGIQPGEGTGYWWAQHMQNLHKWNEATEKYELVSADLPGTVLTAGKYMLEVQLRIEGTDAQTKRLPKEGETPNLTITVDGVNWPHVNDATVEDTYSYDWIKSPEFTLVDDPTGVEDVMNGKVSTKVLRDGVLIIERDGVRYNVLGEIVR